MDTSRQTRVGHGGTMRMKSFRLAFVMCSFVATLPARQAVAENVDESGFQQFTLDYDPSSVAMTNDHKSAYWPQVFFERWRIVTDLNGDGSDDLILSEDPAYFGNGGGPWDVYISSNGNWRCIGDVGMYPGAFAMDKVDDEVELWYYWHDSAREGYVGYHIFRPDGKIKTGNTDSKILVRSDGGGDDNSIFDCLDKAIFGYAHRHPYRFEKSETSTNGVVTWKTIGDWQKPSRMDGLCELKRQLEEAEKRAEAAENELLELSRRLNDLERGVYGICGITLGEKWNGGEKNRICEEVFPGFSNLTVSVDAGNVVTGIRLTRYDSEVSARGIAPREGILLPDKDVIRLVQDKFNIRLSSFGAKGSYFWFGSSVGTSIRLRLATKDGEDSFIELNFLGGHVAR